MLSKEKIQQLSQSYFEEIVDIRRFIHQNPELSNNEIGTSKFIKEKLTDYGIAYKEGYAEHGILGIIECLNPSKRIVALRSELDALPIIEQSNCNYKSLNEGVMHACGHDVHMASLLGAAKILIQLANELEGTILLIFQPAEEKLPGGAIKMLDNGIFNEYVPHCILAQHVMPSYKAGTVGFNNGAGMASVDEIHFTIRGRGGHAALTESFDDSILVASKLIVELKEFVDNRNNSLPTVLSFGRVNAMGAANIIPDSVSVSGTLRTADEAWRKQLLDFIESHSKNVASSHGCICEMNIINGYPVLNNNKELSERLKGVAIDYLGKDEVHDLDFRMTSEDFAYFAQRYPSTFYRLGVMGEWDQEKRLHTSDFDVDENCLKTGMGLMAWLAIKLLQE